MTFRWEGEEIDPPGITWDTFPRRQGMAAIKWMGSGRLGDAAVYVKRGRRAARTQAAADALKGAFGLRAMGTVWWADDEDEWVAMRRHQTIGDLKSLEAQASLQYVDVATSLGRVLLFDLAVANRDRNLSNLLRVPVNGRVELLPIDEAWAFGYDKPWKPRMPVKVARYGLLQLAEHREAWVAGALAHPALYAEVAERCRLPAVSEVPERLSRNLWCLSFELWSAPPVRL